MTESAAIITNFAHLKGYDEQLVRLGMLAERYFADDPNTSLLKARQFAELLAQLVATNVGLFASPERGAIRSHPAFTRWWHPPA